jgi:predicted PurR-regulated permease PerM
MTMQQTRKPVKKKSTEPAAAVQPDNGAPVAQPDVAAVQPQISVMAIVALVLSAFGILLVPGIIGLILAVVALWQINRSEGRLVGRELAVSALVLSTVLLIYHLIFLGAITAAAAAANFLGSAIDGFFSSIAAWFD